MSRVSNRPLRSVSGRPAGYRESQRPKAQSRMSSGPPSDLPVQEDLWFGSSVDAGAEERVAQSMAARVGRILGAKPFPEAARRLDELTRGTSCKIADVVRVLEGDPALSARLLRLVNSSGYALRMRCSSVHHAAVLVGTRRLNQLATTAAVLDMFESSAQVASRVVEHAAVVGSLCRYLAAHFGLPRDELATSGFLHDIGKLMLLETEGSTYAELLADHEGTPDQVSAAERERFGFDHGVLGAHVLSAWHIPEPVPRVVAWHHQPARALRAGGMVAAMVQALRLADAIAHALVATPKGDAIAALMKTEMASYLEIGEAQLAAMWSDFEGLYFHARTRGRDADPEVVPRRPSVEPKSQAPTSKVPKQFACACCAGPSFGWTCAACGGYVCPEHWHEREQWCARCVSAYRSEERDAPLPLGIGVGAAGTVALAAGLGVLASGSGFGAALLVALLAALFSTAVVVILGRVGRRLRFLRQQARSASERRSQPDLMQVELPKQAPLPNLEFIGGHPDALLPTQLPTGAVERSISVPPDPVIVMKPSEPPPAETAWCPSEPPPTALERPCLADDAAAAGASAPELPRFTEPENSPLRGGAQCSRPSARNRCIVGRTQEMGGLGAAPTEPPPPPLAPPPGSPEPEAQLCET